MDNEEKPRHDTPGADGESLSQPAPTESAPDSPPLVAESAPVQPEETPVEPEAAAPAVESTSAEPAEPAPPATPAPVLDEESLVYKVLTDMLRFVGFRSRIEFEKRPEGYYANIRSRQSTALLIGHRGNTLRALQYLVRLIVRQHYPDVPPVTVDVGGYRIRRENFLGKKATAVARIVMETGREMALDLLTEKEMELVREALAAEPGVRVYALGTGLRRNVIIAPVHD